MSTFQAYFFKIILHGTANKRVVLSLEEDNFKEFIK